MTPVDFAEWLWTLIAASGVAVCVWSLIDGYFDRRALKQLNTDGGAQRIVAMDLRSARASLLLHSFFLLLGIFALLTVNPRFSTLYGLFASGYILVAAANARAIGLNQWDRLKMRQGK